MTTTRLTPRVATLVCAGAASVVLLTGCARDADQKADSQNIGFTSEPDGLISTIEAPDQPRGGGDKHAQSQPAGKKLTTADVPAPDPSAAYVPDGFTVEVFAQGMTYPTSVEVDADGNLYVAEAGYSYGDSTVTPRIYRYSADGTQSLVLEGGGLQGPINDLLLHDGKLFVSHRGKVSTLDPTATRPALTDIVTGLPSAGDHQNNQLTVGPDGKLYLGQGTATNSGVVGMDNANMGWLKKHPDFHDIPAAPIQSVGRTYQTKDPLGDGAEAVTSAFMPFGEAAKDGQQIEPQTKAGGTILRMNTDGSDLEVYAWGLRNLYGLIWHPNGKLFATENGMDIRGSRPVANDRDDLYVIEQGVWYGWLDFAMGLPVTDSQFKPEGKPQPQFVMAEHPPVQPPLLTFPKHASVTKVAVAPAGPFGEGRLFVACSAMTTNINTAVAKLATKPPASRSRPARAD